MFQGLGDNASGPELCWIVDDMSLCELQRAAKWWGTVCKTHAIFGFTIVVYRIYPLTVHSKVVAVTQPRIFADPMMDVFSQTWLLPVRGASSERSLRIIYGPAGWSFLLCKGRVL